MKKTRSDIVREECTRDAIFLFQVASLAAGENFADLFHYDDDRYDREAGTGCRFFMDAGGEFFDREKPCDGSSFERADAEDLIEAGIYTKEWRTEGVWLTREEAEDFGRKHTYRYVEGWRVYAVPANGALAAMLRENDVVEIRQGERPGAPYRFFRNGEPLYETLPDPAAEVPS